MRGGTNGQPEPRISVGMPVRDGGRYLRPTLEALLAQEVDGLEVVISDNASTDGTAEICREFAARDPRIRYLRNTENIGAAANYNKVFHLSRAPLFKWAAHDDLLAPGYLATCVAELERAPAGVALVYPRTTLIDERGEVLRHFDDNLDLRSTDPAVRLRDFARNWNLCNPCFGVIRSSVLGRTRLIEPYISSDVTLLAELALHGQYWEIPERLFLRRIHDRSSRQGTLTLAETAQWFDPRRRGKPVLPPRTRVYFEIMAMIARSDLDRRQRLRCALALSTTWHWRRARARAGRVRRSVRGRLARAGRPAR